ncbi:hypothetical protein [Salana multivorans]
MSREYPPQWASLRTTASHTIGAPHLTELLREVPPDAPAAAYRDAVVEDNVLGRPTHTGRLRTYRHLRELYLLDPSAVTFSALRRLWDHDTTARPLLAGIAAFTRDALLRASWPAVARSTPGSVVISENLAHAVAETHAGELSPATLGKVGRNTAACWTQTGHLVGRSRKVRSTIEARPAAVALAAYLGHLGGQRALRVLDNPWSQLLDLHETARLEALRRAHDAGLLDLQVAGHVVEVGFSFLECSAR